MCRREKQENNDDKDYDDDEDDDFFPLSSSYDKTCIYLVTYLLMLMINDYVLFQRNQLVPGWLKSLKSSGQGQITQTSNCRE